MTNDQWESIKPLYVRQLQTEAEYRRLEKKMRDSDPVERERLDIEKLIAHKVWYIARDDYQMAKGKLIDELERNRWRGSFGWF